MKVENEKTIFHAGDGEKKIREHLIEIY